MQVFLGIKKLKKLNYILKSKFSNKLTKTRQMSEIFGGGINFSVKVGFFVQVLTQTSKPLGKPKKKIKILIEIFQLDYI